jgi:hypothetical protein
MIHSHFLAQIGLAQNVITGESVYRGKWRCTFQWQGLCHGEFQIVYVFVCKCARYLDFDAVLQILGRIDSGSYSSYPSSYFILVYAPIRPCIDGTTPNLSSKLGGGSDFPTSSEEADELFANLGRNFCM